MLNEKNLLANLYSDLETFKDFEKDSDNCERFLDTCDEIIKLQDPSSIGILLSYFDDESDYSWVFESLKGAIEHYPQEIYIKEVLKNIGNLFNKAPSWTDSICSTLFNSIDDRKIFKENMYLTSHQTLRKVFDFINSQSLHYENLIKDFCNELDKKNNHLY